MLPGAKKRLLLLRARMQVKINLELLSPPLFGGRDGSHFTTVNMASMEALLGSFPSRSVKIVADTLIRGITALFCLLMQATSTIFALTLGGCVFCLFFQDSIPFSSLNKTAAKGSGGWYLPRDGLSLRGSSLAG